MTLTEGKSAIWLPPFIALALWEAIYLTFEFLFPTGSNKLLLGPVLVSLEFAVIFALSLWQSAHLSRRGACSFMGALRQFAILFAAFLLVALASTFLTHPDISEFESFMDSLTCFAFLALVKLGLGLFALAIGHYLPPQGKWDGFLLPGVAITLLALGAALAIGLIAGYLFSSAFDYQSSEGFSVSADNCTAGEWAYIKAFGSEFNITVTGIETYRTRRACHAGSVNDDYGKRIIIDVYGQDEDSVCYIINRTTSYNTTIVEEDCEGDWPGYVKEKD